jgi:hypothetical protein
MSRVDRLAGDGYAFETLTVADTAVECTKTTWMLGEHSHTRAIVTNAGGIVRYRYDGPNPTATVGHMLGHGDMVILEGSVNITNFRAIRAGTNNGILSITYERV